MIGFFIYLIEATACFTVLYIFYKHLIYRETYFEWNRLYFLFSVVICLILPAITIPVPVEPVNWNANQIKQVVSFNSFGQQSLLFVQPEKQQSFFDIFTAQYMNVLNLVLIVYLSGVAKHLFVIFLKLRSVFITIKRFPTEKHEEYTIVRTNNKTTAYSFFRYIFLNSDFNTLKSEDKQQILDHEIVHVKQMHTIDNLLFELLHAIFWFNPVMKKMKQTVKEIHEYIADSIAVGNRDKVNYMQLIMQQSFRRVTGFIVNHFSRNDIKQRISILSVNEPDRLRKMRFLITLPVLFMVLWFFSFVKEIGESFQKQQAEYKYFEFPVKSNYTIAQEFYINKPVMYSKQNNKAITGKKQRMLISHPQISFIVPDHTPVVAIANGLITDISETDNWGLPEKNITIKHSDDLVSKYKKLYKVTVKKGFRIHKGDTIAYTGDRRLYMVFDFQLLHENKPVDPLKYLH